MFLERGLLPRDHQHPVLLITDADFPDGRLRAPLPRQRSNCRGSNGQFQKFPTLHNGLLTRMPPLRAIIQSEDDGAALERCRVLCKNSNMRAVVSTVDTAFLSTILPRQVQFFPRRNLTPRRIQA